MPDNKIKKILFIDDDKMITNMYQRAFQKREDYRLLVAANSQDGEKIIREEKPDLILLDLVFPKEEGLFTKGGPIKINVHAGYKLLEKLKKDPQTKKIPIVILTNLSDRGEEETKARELGADDYLVKARYVPREIIGKIDEILGKKK
jgi:DNA-binding response OmpR family regulator